MDDRANRHAWINELLEDKRELETLLREAVLSKKMDDNWQRRATQALAEVEP